MGILTYRGTDFLMDGEKFTILSGSIHYFRIPREYWEDRLKKLKACGFNTVETYVCWNLHERREGEFDFSGMLDIRHFVELAQQLGLYVIVRPGPYICAEWEMGGFPSWLLRYPGMKVRCYDELYLSKVRRYYENLFQILRPCLSTNGGNIIAVQIENEYGSFGNDKKYLQAIADIYRENGVDCLLFTSDGPDLFLLAGGTLDGYLATVNFGSRPKENFEVLREFRKSQPLMCCEFWNGWFDHWYEEHHTRSAEDVADTLDEMLELDASVNFYMFHGGTNFGYTNGSNCDGGVLQPTITSYDYDCLLNEAGDRTEKYYAVKSVLEKRFGKAPEMEVSDSAKRAYGSVELTESAELLENLDVLSAAVSESAAPLSMEELGQDFGFILYETTLRGPMGEMELTIEGLHDRAHLFLDGKLCGIKENTGFHDDRVTVQLEAGEEKKLQVLVENLGRANYGHTICDRRGITGGICLYLQYQFGFVNRSLPLEDLDGLSWRAGTAGCTPVFLRGTFEVDKKADTFLRLDGFSKGQCYINGFLLGRYWNTAGPQKTLYLPAPLLKEGENELVVLELDSFDRPCVTLTDEPDLG